MTRSTELIKTVIERISTSNGFGKCMKNVKILSAGDATIIDCISTYALMTRGTGAPGVSVNMNISYMKPAFPGEVVEVDAKTIRAGRTLAYLAVDLTKNNGKDIIANGKHIKFIL
ncbi:acyl-coenzyme A thioesterase 13-like isoform X2 [Polistes fuscatus]|uniref:acyl-coenzyme A thioesterase 13-like isoform X2 n=1 Tax=Polistes fuscatus TaxID=30207 RepID=UPI001CA9E9A4|nr:acyl-coenzyme A thioesterase 13-like isoform X2 [Polistes fuscatus]